MDSTTPLEAHDGGASVDSTVPTNLPDSSGDMGDDPQDPLPSDTPPSDTAAELSVPPASDALPPFEAAASEENLPQPDPNDADDPARARQASLDREDRIQR
ncbi:hypothetical protein QQX98_007923 [Neonectria punicea]|uniref:Uncharacterized protein n=1 Tax=Neonectria punicea TaxID=979145 RepID=A0ABR1GWJ5_9HYPO